jgi:hypothetical protein
VTNHRQDGGRNGALPDENRSTGSPQAQTQSLSHASRGNASDDHRWWRDRNYRDDDRCDNDRQGSEVVPRRWEAGRGSGFGYVDPMGAWSGFSAGYHGFGAGSQDYPGQGEAPRSSGPTSLGYRGAGPHRGKGPVGYRRSDERIHELVCEALAEDDQLDASGIEVSVTNSDVRLSGVVEDRRARFEAEDCAYSVSGVRNVQNLLSVIGDSPSVKANPTLTPVPAYGRNGRERDPLGGQEAPPANIPRV